MANNELRIPLQTPTTETTESSTFLKACFNATNAFLGMGLMTVPYALSSGGWLSLILFFLIVVVTFFTAILLKRCMDTDPSIRSYVDIAEQAFGKKGRIIVMIILNIELYLVDIGFLMLEADNLHKLFPEFIIKLGDLTMDGKLSFVLITALIIFPSMLLIDLSLLSYVSATGVFSCLIILVSVFCVGLFNGVGFHEKGRLLNVKSLPTAMSLYMVCFAGHSMIPSIYTSMRNTYRFNKVLLFSFILTTLTCLATAMVGYLMYGDSVESEITLNLPTNKVCTKFAIYTTLLMPITKYALILTPVATAIEGELSEKYKNKRSVRSMIRVGLLISTVIMACVFPYYESLMAIVGSIFVVLTSFLLPCLCYLKISSDLRCGWKFEQMGIVGIFVFGILAGVLGTYSSVSDLVT